MSLTVGEVAVGTVGPAARQALALVGPSVNLGARLVRAVAPGRIAASAEVVAALEAEAPPHAAKFRRLDRAFDVPGADGLAVAVYALDESATAVA